MDKANLYNKLAERKFKPKDLEPYVGGNGRVDKALNLYKTGKLKSGGVHIDVGGGIGDLGYVLRKEGLFEKTLVVDIAAKNLEAAKAKGNYVVQADIDKHGFGFNGAGEIVDPDWSVDGLDLNGHGKIDAISALDFIEHIIDPGGFAVGCFGLLKSGGEVFINTPNIQFWRHIETLMYLGKFPHTSGDTEVYHGGHLAFFTYLDLVEIFSKAGFSEFEQFMDEEGFAQPPAEYITRMRPQNQNEYKQLSMRFGCPNLLFKAAKP